MSSKSFQNASNLNGLIYLGNDNFFGISVGKDYDWRVANSKQSALIVGEHVAFQQDDPGSLATVRIFPEGTSPSPTQVAIEPYWINSVNDLNSVGNGEDITSMLCGASSPITVGGGEERGGWIFKNRFAGQDYRHHQITSFATINGTVRPVHVVLGPNSLMKFDYAQEKSVFDNSTVTGSVSQGNTIIDVINSPGTNALRLFCRSTGEHGLSNITSGTEDVEVRFGNYGIGVYDAGGDTPAARLETRHANSTLAAELHTATNASYAGELIKLATTRAKNTAFAFLTARADGDLTFNLRGDGNAFADGTWTGGGADYAEFFEWSDGNASAEDRIGVSVVLDSGKIRPAVAGESPIGVISGNASVIGDAAWNHWSEKYQKDEFGRKVFTHAQTVSWTEVIPAVTESVIIKHSKAVVGPDGKPSTLEWDEPKEKTIQEQRAVEHSYFANNVPAGVVVPKGAIFTTVKVPVVNPSFDEAAVYVPRSDRKEWSTVGLIGKLRIKKGQPTAASWIKLKDISTSVEEWLVK
jgi:hypothetical protein